MKARILTSQRFVQSYDRCSGILQGLVEGAVHDFVRRYESNPTTVAGRYDKLSHLGSSTSVLEIEVTGKDRLLAWWQSATLTLLEVGNHDVGKSYTRQMLEHDKSHLTPAAPKFSPDRNVQRP